MGRPIVYIAGPLSEAAQERQVFSLSQTRRKKKSAWGRR